MGSDLIDVDAWTEVITIPADGDEYVAASVEGAFQALANRTRNLRNLIVGNVQRKRRWPVGSNGFGSRTPVGAGSVRNFGNSGAGIALIHSSLDTPLDSLTWRERLPQLQPGMVLNGWRARVTSAVSSADVTVNLRRYTAMLDTPFTNVNATIGAPQVVPATTSATVGQTVDETIIADTDYALEFILPGTPTSGQAFLYAYELTWTGPKIS